MKFLTVIGARPQFIKAAPISRELRNYHQEIILHTGQHYDKNMSDIFFEELNIPKPDYHLHVGSSSHAYQTAEMLKGIEDIIQQDKPDYVLVYGDTNSTLAGAIAASKLHIPVIHIEAGLRSFNKKMPEEINRIMTDHVSEYLFCPTETAVKNLLSENITKGVYNVGDVMYDAVDYNLKLAKENVSILEKHNLSVEEYLLITVHRAENTDNEKKLRNILKALAELEEVKVWPIHPRTKHLLEKLNIKLENIPNLIVIDPVGYLDMLVLQNNAKKILTDSGGVQKEAYFLEKPCVTLREQTEWVETLEDNANILVGTNVEGIIQAVNLNVNPTYHKSFGDGNSAKKIVTHFI